MVRLSRSESTKNIWVWLLWGLGFYLLMELGAFFIVKWALKKLPGDLIGPYLAFAAPGAILLPLVWWLRKWEERRVAVTILARGWGLSMVVFGVALAFAVEYSAAKLHLGQGAEDATSFVVVVLFMSAIFYFGMYHRALKVILSRDPRSATEVLGKVQKRNEELPAPEDN